jgi:hypothetical protein
LDDPLDPDRNLFWSAGGRDDIRIFSAKPTAMMRAGLPRAGIPDRRSDAAEQFRDTGLKNNRPTADGEPPQPTKSSEENLLSSTTLVGAPHSPIRKTIRSIVIVVAALMFVMWTLVGLSLVASYKAELAATASGGRNLMIAFREEVASILRGVEGEMDEIAEKMRHQQNKFDLYAWAWRTCWFLPGWRRPRSSSPMDSSGRRQ